MSYFAFFVLVGIQTGISLTANGQLIFPFVLAACAACPLIFRYKKDIPLKEISYILLFTISNCIINSFYLDNFFDSLRSVAALSNAIWIGTSIYLFNMNYNKIKINNFYFIISTLFIVLAYLEIYTNFRIVSDMFRLYINEWRGVYLADERDINNYGGIRSKVFASEPSILGIVSSFVFMSWYLTVNFRTFFNKILYIILNVAMFYAARSATIFIFMFVGFTMSYFQRRRNASLSLMVAATCFFLIAIVAIYSIEYFLNAPESGGYFRTGSYFIRQIGPPIIAWEAILESPILGLGIGESRQVYDLIMDQYAKYGLFDLFPYFINAELGWRQLVTNAFFELWISFGLSAIFFIYLIGRLVGTGGSYSPMVTLWCALLLSLSFGGMNTVYFWMFVMGLASLGGFRRAQEAPQIAKPAPSDLPPNRERPCRLPSRRLLTW